MSRKLATLRLDVPLHIDLDRLHPLNASDLEGLRKIYRDMEFTSLYNEIKVVREAVYLEVSALDVDQRARIGPYGQDSGRLSLRCLC